MVSPPAAVHRQASPEQEKIIQPGLYEDRVSCNLPLDCSRISEFFEGEQRVENLCITQGRITTPRSQHTRRRSIRTSSFLDLYSLSNFSPSTSDRSRNQGRWDSESDRADSGIRNHGWLRSPEGWSEPARSRAHWL